MGNSLSSPPGSSGTTFVNSDQPSASSCQIVGDSSLYGVGVRTSYYLQYVAALLSLLFLGGRDQKLWFLSFVPLAAANLIILSLNATGGGLVILDWAIVYGLVLWSFVFLVWTVCYQAIRAATAAQAGDPKQLQHELESEGGRAVGDQEAEWHARYITVLRVLNADEDRSTKRYAGKEGGRYALGRALREYVAAFASTTPSPPSAGAGAYIRDLYADGRVEVAAAQMMVDNSQVEAFRDGHVEALRRANMPFDQAQATVQLLAKVAMGSGKKRSHGSLLQILTALSTNPVTTTISSGLGLVLYSGFSTFTIWLLFRAVSHGFRAGCDIRIILIFVPVSIYRRGVITALRVLSCISLAVIGAPSLLAGLFLLLAGLKSFLSNPVDPDPTLDTPLPFKSIPYDVEKGKETEITSPTTTFTRFSRTSDFYEMDQYPQPSSAAGRDTKGSSYFDSLLKESEQPTAALRGGDGAPAKKRKPQIRWTYLLIIPIAYTAAVVEATIRINRIEMRQRAMTSLGELIAFFLGSFVFFRVVASCLKRARRKDKGRNEERWNVLEAPATRLEESGFGGVLGGPLGKEISIGESFVEGPAVVKGKKRIYMQPQRQSQGSVGRFRELIDEGD